MVEGSAAADHRVEPSTAAGYHPTGAASILTIAVAEPQLREVRIRLTERADSLIAAGPTAWDRRRVVGRPRVDDAQASDWVPACLRCCPEEPRAAPLPDLG